MAIQLIETTELEPGVSTLSIQGVPVSASCDMSPQQLWDYYRDLQLKSAFEVKMDVHEIHNDESASD